MAKHNYTNLDKNLIFQETFLDEQSVRRNGGIPTDMAFDKGIGEFNGSTSVVEYSGYADIVPRPSSFRCRIKFDDEEDAVVFQIFGQNGQSMNLSIRAANGVLSFASQLSQYHTVLLSAYDFTEWHEIIGTVNSVGTTVLYIDGVSISTAGSAGWDPTSNTLKIGGRGAIGALDKPFGGDIELLEFYNKVLTAEEVSNLYSNSRYKEPQLDTADHQRILHVNSFDGVARNLLSGDLLEDLTAPINLTDGWNNVGDGTVTDSNNFDSGTSDGVDKSIVEVGKKYRCYLKGVTLGTLFQFRNQWTGSTTYYSTSDSTFDVVFEFTAVENAIIYLKTTGTNVNTYIEHFSLQEIIPEVVNTDIEVVKDSLGLVPRFNGSSSLIGCGSYASSINTVIAWAKPKTADESIVDLGGGNTITIASGVLTAAWADDLYVDGATATAIKHNEWSLIVCRVDTALALTDIDIGKISTAFYDGMLDDIIFIDGAITNAEVSQVYTSTKHKYGK